LLLTLATVFLGGCQSTDSGSDSGTSKLRDADRVLAIMKRLGDLSSIDSTTVVRTLGGHSQFRESRGPWDLYDIVDCEDHAIADIVVYEPVGAQRRSVGATYRGQGSLTLQDVTRVFGKPARGYPEDSHYTRPVSCWAFNVPAGELGVSTRDADGSVINFGVGSLDPDPRPQRRFNTR